MNVKYLSAIALLFACASGAGFEAHAASACTVHVYPADGVHSVGEDFDAVHRVDQDLRHYNEVAGRPLNWLTPDQQLSLLREIPLATLAGVGDASTVLHPQSLSRHQALEPGPHEDASGCAVEILVPQIMLERGGLASRSLRVFGVVRRFEGGALASSYSGFAAAPMTGFQMKSPADAESATQLVEAAYKSAVESLLSNAFKKPKK